MKWLLVCAVLLSATIADAQYFKQKRNNDYVPKALLVEFFTRKRQRDYLQERGDTATLRKYLQEAYHVNQLLIRDFSRNVNFCPVYFFADTNADQIRRGKFAGVLLDSNLNVVAAPAIADGEKEIFIGYFGYVEANRSIYGSQATEKEKRDFDPGYDNSGRQKFITLDADFNILSARKPRSIAGGSWLFGQGKRRVPKFVSFNYDLDYYPHAYKYNEALWDFYGDKREKQKASGKK